MTRPKLFAPLLLLAGCIACSQAPAPSASRANATPAPGAGATTPAPDTALTPVPVFTDSRQAAIAAASADRAVADAAIAYLRALGPAGLDVLKQAHGAEIAFRLGEAATGSAPDAAAGDRVLRAFDKVSGQHDGWASGLYWHTDAETARAEARARGLPILNLYLLGTLDDEFC
ncbi:MAG: hypothetical protein HS108_05215 [Planctomycetes bacterium]|nr:hypothetical protein [Planctomycetota bacterium]MCL4730848.1 hypothetical protein [Planctomycetota bacterium]